MFKKTFLNRSLMTAIMLLTAWGLKYHYSNSSSDDLRWILAPTAFLVEMTGSMDFEMEINTGYVNNSNGIVIAPSCSGVNFLIILFCLSACTGIKKFKPASRQLLWIPASLVISYACTLLVNTVRIHLSIYSIRAKLFETWFTAETVHLAEGVLVYFIFLLIYYFLLIKIMNHDFKGDIDKPVMLLKKALLPLAFYLGFTLLIPVLNSGGIPSSKDFAKYATIVLITCPLVILLFVMLRFFCHRMAQRVQG